MAVPDEQVGITVGFAVLVFMDIVGNMLVIMVIVANKSLHTPMNWFLVNLAGADICVAVFQAFRFIFFFFIDHREDYETKMMCTFLTGGTFTWVGGLASAYTLVVIAVERYYAILHPHHSRNRLTMRKIKIIMLSTWIVAAVFCLPLFLSRMYSKKRHFCVEDWPSRTVAQVYGICWLFVGGLIPSSIMTFLYARVVCNLWFTRSAEVESTQRARMRVRKKLTEIVIAVTVIYIVCWNPVMVIYTLAQFGPTFVGSQAQRVGIFLVTLNSTVNPLLYTFHSKKFRTHLIDIALCRAKWCPNKRRIHPFTDGSSSREPSTKRTTAAVVSFEVRPDPGSRFSVQYDDHTQPIQHDDLFDET